MDRRYSGSIEGRSSSVSAVPGELAHNLGSARPEPIDQKESRNLLGEATSDVTGVSDHELGRGQIGLTTVRTVRTADSGPRPSAQAYRSIDMTFDRVDSYSTEVGQGRDDRLDAGD